jgi:hypothetical protein
VVLQLLPSTRRQGIVAFHLLLVITNGSLRLQLPLLAVDGCVHPLDNSVDSVSSHYKRVMLEDTVNVETLHFKTLKNSANLIDCSKCNS